jgi:UDPglucose 6-dehydrogenase
MDESFVRRAAKEIAASEGESRDLAVVTRSTVVPGTTERVVIPEFVGWRRRPGFASVPEFLREGSLVNDAKRPDRLVIGADSPATARKVKSLYAKARCAHYLTDLRTAEAVKYVTNAILATKVSLANELANILQSLGVSYDEVLKGVALDRRISTRFMVPGVGFGGSCFPKDVRGLVAAAEERGSGSALLGAVLAVNEMQPLRAVELVEKELGGLDGKRVALLGLAFKGGTDDIRESRAVPIAKALMERGAEVVGYDPQAMENFRAAMPKVALANSVAEALEGADACIVQADWEEFAGLTASDFGGMKIPLVVDGRRSLDPGRLKGVTFRRIG